MPKNVSDDIPKPFAIFLFFVYNINIIKKLDDFEIMVLPVNFYVEK